MSDWQAYLLKREALELPSRKIQIGNSANGLEVKKAVDWVYFVLTVLDTKASALMRLNGVLIAAAAFLLAQYTIDGTLMINTWWHPLIIVCAALLSSVSITLCLFVVSVSWNFLGKVEIDNEDSFTQEVKSLVVTMKRRQCVYRIAWAISFLASVLFLVELIAQTAHIAYTIISKLQ